MDENFKVLIEKAKDGQRVQKPRTEYADMLAALENRITDLKMKHKDAVTLEFESLLRRDLHEHNKATAAREAAGRELALARKQEAALNELIPLLPPDEID